MNDQPSGSKVRPRGPGLVYSALAMVMLVVVGVVALTATQPPPPTIAEFAPQAVEQITDAPSEQTSRFGSGSGGEGPCPAGATDCEGGGGGGLDLPTRTPAPIDVPRVRKCIGDPPRQTEDPQSPPCVPYWSGDNGGSTWKGVTGDEIVVAWPRTAGHDDNSMNSMVNFFNRRFEFYGRKIRLKVLEMGGDGSPASLQKDAVAVDQELGAFASLTYSQDISKGGQSPYYDELSRREIMSFNYLPDFLKEGHLANRAPYQWAAFPEFPQFQRHLAEWMCNGLKGRSASYAGPGTVGSQRVFGIIRESANNSTIKPDIGVLRRELDACGAPVAVDVHSESTNAQSVMLDMMTAEPSPRSSVSVTGASRSVWPPT